MEYIFGFGLIFGIVFGLIFSLIINPIIEFIIKTYGERKQNDRWIRHKDSVQ